MNDAHRGLALALAAALALFGCGSDGDGGSDTGSETSSDTGSETTSDTTSDQTEADASAPVDDGQAVEDDVADQTPDAAGETADAADETADADADMGPTGLPRELAITFTREAAGEPIPAEEVTAFTKRVTGVWKQVDWFRWILRTSMGVDASASEHDYLAWHNDTLAVKAGDTVTFQEKGHEHNMWIPSSTVLSQAMNGYLLTGKWTHAKAAEQYCKGLSAVIRGFRWGPDDPAPYLMARAVFPMDQSFVLDSDAWQDDGRKKAVEFHEAYTDDIGWNAESFSWPQNPAWGSIWVTNMRSKDDVRAIARTNIFLHYIVEDAPDEWVREACAETLDMMVGFNKDIVDSGYYIRTKGPDGVAYSFDHQDLGNYVAYTGFDEENECPARLATDLIAYGEHLTNECGTGFGNVFDLIAPQANYYNYPIVWDYHMAAVGETLVHRHDETALELLGGLADRVDAYLDPETEEVGVTNPHWKRDMALLLVQAAAVGLPLTADEARRVHDAWNLAADEFEAFERWDLWDESIPDGDYGGGGGYRPKASAEAAEVEHFALFLETCNSPFLNPAGAAFVDCDVVKDPAQWGLD